jgi:hypothetical protein
MCTYKTYLVAAGRHHDSRCDISVAGNSTPRLFRSVVLVGTEQRPRNYDGIDTMHRYEVQLVYHNEYTARTILARFLDGTPVRAFGLILALVNPTNFHGG